MKHPSLFHFSFEISSFVARQHILTCRLVFHRFRMKCHLCVNYIEMQTDPATCDYLIVSGAQRKEERWDMAENEQILTTGAKTHDLSIYLSVCSSVCLSSSPSVSLYAFKCFSMHYMKKKTFESLIAVNG